ncbi:MAG: glutamate--tRNA ligase [Gemmatimonadales bacterium]|jgi:glutamyl-tRNA synthetase
MSDRPRVRFAPSPTGFLHVGGARTALFNWLFARHEGGAFVLRIEDTDRERSRPELTDGILDGLMWLGLDWDEGPYHQVDDLERHAADVQRLLQRGAAYHCFCSPERLEQLREKARAEGTAAAYDGHCRQLGVAEAARRAEAGEPYTVRFRMPHGVTEWDDGVAGRTRFRNSDVEDFILLRSDSTPTYNLAVVSDDVAMRITHVIRGADHISNTPKQIQIYRALAAPEPSFSHVPLILGPDGKRLSKRHGATAVGEYRQRGYLPAAMNNFLALLGWSPGDDREVMDLDELVERFTLGGINRKPAVFDQEKLDWLNGQYIASTPGARLAARIGPRLAEKGIATTEELESRPEWITEVLDAVKVRARTLVGLAELARPFFAGRLDYEPQAVAKHWKDRQATGERLRDLAVVLAKVEPWDEEALEAALRELAERLGIGAGKLIHPTRVALTGCAVSPGIFEVMRLMGREVVLDRIAAAESILEGVDALGSET